MSPTRRLVATLITLSVSTSYARAGDDEVDPDSEQDGDQDKKAKKKKKDQDDPEKKDDKDKDKRIPEIGGYVQGTFSKGFDTNDDGTARPEEFRVRRLRLKVKGKLVKKVAYNVELDPLAADFTELLRDAYVEFKHLPNHEIRVGQQKTQFGYENLESSGKLYVVNRADVSSDLARGNTTRDIGVGLMGEIPLGRGYSIEDGITIVNGAGQNTREDTRRKNVFGRLGGRFQCEDLELDVRAGGSFGYGDTFDIGDPADLLDDRRYLIKRFGADVQVDHEYAFVAFEAVTGQDRDLATDEEIDRNGWYLLAAGKTPWHAGPVIRFDTLEADERWTFGGYWGDVDARLRAMVEYERRKDKDDRLIVWTQGKF